jgi:hypothetical protein
MARPQHDAQRQGEQDEQDDKGEGDAEAPAALGGGHRGDGGGRLGHGAAPVEAGQERRLVHADRARVGLDEPAGEHLPGQVVEAVLLEQLELAKGDTGHLRQLPEGDVADLPLVLEKVPDGVNVGHGAHVIRMRSFRA